MPPARTRKPKKPGRKNAAAQRAVQPAAAERAVPAPRRRLLPPFVDSLLLRIPFFARRRAAQFSRLEVLSTIPVRNDLIEWELREPKEEESEATAVVVLQVPRRQDRWGRMLNHFFEGPSHRQVVLDELGTDVWQMCDGQTSIEDLIRALARKHKLERREVEISLTLYLKTLARRGFIGLRLERE